MCGDCVFISEDKRTKRRMIIAVTGTPGVGKTSVCECLRRMMPSVHVMHLNDVIRERFHCGFDKKRGCFIADLRRLRRHVRGVHRRMMRMKASNATKSMSNASKARSTAMNKSDEESPFLLILDGHLSHLMHPDVTIVLRANPIELARRLRRRGFDERKIEENVHAEILDVILIESVERCKVVYEIDTTNLRVEDVAERVREIIEAEVACITHDLFKTPDKTSNSNKASRFEGASEMKERDDAGDADTFKEVRDMLRARYAPGSVDWSEYVNAFI